MEENNQIFIKFESEEEPIEFLLMEQPLTMIRAEIVTKDEIRDTVETGISPENDTYAKLYVMQDYGIAITVNVRIDGYLRTVENVEKSYF